MGHGIDEAELAKAARCIREADALLIGAGAGMGVDSGLPDFRGPTGFWRAYPPLARLGLAFEDIANPAWFRNDPHLAWGFYGHRLTLYRERQPHSGYHILLKWALTKPAGYFVFTSNVDRHFARAGFAEERLVECHGSIEHWQCTKPCSRRIWSAEGETVCVDDATLRAQEPLPRCPWCQAIARPNILMFCDWNWIEDRTAAQQRTFDAWLGCIVSEEARLTILEIGAGSAVPTVRWTMEAISRTHRATLVRINPREVEGPVGCISLAGGALEILQNLDARLNP
ncbi:MAG: hypothetical protein N2Z21_07120 [Candidatus Sumerlaeaceae bacterium]|nr:hypothetical protein [Candidatus Sumerlaeaceae bacterium]